LSAAAVVGLLAGRFGGQPETAVFCLFALIGVALAAIDISVQRLPDRLTLPAYPVLIALLGVCAAVDQEAGALVRALLGAVVMGGGYLLLALVRPGQLGGGDIKLAGLAGLVLGWLGWPALLSGAVLAFLLLAVTSLALVATRRLTLRGMVSFGPFILGGTVLALLISQ
jgi:leader peptidase (prepilin peptidase)/N-methyltransferase